MIPEIKYRALCQWRPSLPEWHPAWQNLSDAVTSWLRDSAPGHSEADLVKALVLP